MFRELSEKQVSFLMRNAHHRREMAARKAARDKRYAAINNRPTHWKFGRSKYIPGGARMNVNHQPKAMRG